ARKRFGNVQAVREECRETRGANLGETLLQDVRFGLRMLRKNPGFTSIAVLTLALGIGANTTLFSLVNGVLLKPLPYPGSGRLVALFNNEREQGQDYVGLTAPAFVDWRAQSASFEDVAAYQPGGFDLTGNGEPARVFGVRASASFFPLLGVQPMLGRNFTSQEDVEGKKQVVILGNRLWRERFNGSRDILGKGITLDGNVYSIIGVLPREFHFGPADADLWVPMGFESWELENRGGHNYQAIGKLKPGVPLEQARAEMATITHRLGQQYEPDRGWGVTLLPLRDQLVGDCKRPLYIMSGAVGFVLLIACSNVANLLLARAFKRAREFAIRGALGAGRPAIIRQLVLESLVLAAAGAVAGWFLAQFSLALVLKLGTLGLPRLESVRLDGAVAVFSAFITLLTGLAFGLVPAWFASRISLNDALNDSARGSTGGRGSRLRNGFVAAQFAFALVLLISAGLLGRSFASIRASDPGYRPDHILTASVFMPDSRFPGNSFSEREPYRKAFLAQLVERAAALPGVESAAVVMGLPLTAVGGQMQVQIPGRPELKPAAPRPAGYSQVSPNYFQTMGIRLLQGRSFDRHDTGAAPFVAIVNESFLRTFFPNGAALGQHLRVMDGYRDRPTEIVGIIQDTRQRSLTAPPEPEMYFPIEQRCWFTGQLVLRTQGDPVAVIPALTKAVTGLDARQPLYDVRTLTSLMADSYSRQRLQMILLAVFAAVGLTLALVGVYGVMASVVAQRRREIGVRLALGAQRHQVLLMVSWQAMKPCLAGIMIGLVAALALTRLLRSLLFEVTPTDQMTFVMVPLLLIIAAFAGGWLPAQRAANTDPMQALRYE
ncbi:MAG TPA: ABC transporter permease, partial [Dongiaceae bacterium]|nr:ABC transporter permease [Dongiaceae bacterium]